MSAWLLILERVDERVFHALTVRRRSLLHGSSKLLTRFADPSVAIALALFLFLLPFRTGSLVAASAGATLAVSHLLVQVLKRVASRPRPSLPPGRAALIEAPDRFSFPSGHATAALSLAVPVALYFDGLIAVGLFTFVFLIGVSRCYLGLHYPGDVVGGWVLALCTYAAVEQVLDVLMLTL